MIDALISGKLIKQPELKTSQNNKLYSNFLLSVSTGDTENTVISGIAFGEQAERISKLGKGDAISVVGSLKPTEWQDKSSNETKHGLSVTVSDVLSVYDIKKRRKPDATENSTQQDRPDYGKPGAPRQFSTDKSHVRPRPCKNALNIAGAANYSFRLNYSAAISQFIRLLRIMDDEIFSTNIPNTMPKIKGKALGWLYATTIASIRAVVPSIFITRLRL